MLQLFLYNHLSLFVENVSRSTKQLALNLTVPQCWLSVPIDLFQTPSQLVASVVISSDSTEKISSSCSLNS